MIDWSISLYEKSVYGENKEVTKPAVDKVLAGIGLSALTINANVLLSKGAELEVSFFVKLFLDSPLHFFWELVARAVAMFTQSGVAMTALKILSFSSLLIVFVVAIAPLLSLLRDAIRHSGRRFWKAPLEWLKVLIAVNWALLVCLFVSGTC